MSGIATERKSKPYEFRFGRGSASGGSGGRGDGAVTAFAFLVVEKSLKETGAIEIRPERFRDKDFRVGNLPEQKIADAHFPAGANQEIGIGKVGGVEMSGEIFFGDGLAKSRRARRPFGFAQG